jgi:hypothetical protein
MDGDSHGAKLMVPQVDFDSSRAMNALQPSDLIPTGLAAHRWAGWT